MGLYYTEASDEPSNKVTNEWKVKFNTIKSEYDNAMRSGKYEKAMHIGDSGYRYFKKAYNDLLANSKSIRDKVSLSDDLKFAQTYTAIGGALYAANSKRKGKRILKKDYEERISSKNPKKSDKEITANTQRKLQKKKNVDKAAGILVLGSIVSLQVARFLMTRGPRILKNYQKKCQVMQFNALNKLQKMNKKYAKN